jgi:hypothetical protein
MPLFPLLLIAAAFWGQTPACGQPTISRAELPPPVVGLADLSGCAILIDPSRLRGAGMVCMAVLHEYGHELGLGHSTDPNNVMYPVIHAPVWPCAW